MTGHRWLREYRTAVTTTGGQSALMKPLCLFLEKVVGWTFVEESVGAGGSFRSYSVSGSVGSFSGSDFNFTSTYGFSTTAINDTVIIRDTANPENSGVYTISAKPDANTVTLNFRTAAGEFPTASTGVWWYTLTDSYQVPSTDGDYIIYQTPDSSGFQVKIYRQDSSTYYFYLSPNATWTGEDAIVLGPSVYICSNTDPSTSGIWCYAPIDGEGFVFWWISTQASAADVEGLIIVSKINRYDTDNYNANEAVGLFGTTSGDSLSITRYNSTATALTTAMGFLWDDVAKRQVYKNTTTAQSFNSTMIEENEFVLTNSMTGYGYYYLNMATNNRMSKIDLRYGSIIGVMSNYDGSVGMNIYGTLLCHYNTTRTAGTKLTALNYDGTRDMYFINSGFVVPWPGYTAQLTG